MNILYIHITNNIQYYTYVRSWHIGSLKYQFFKKASRIEGNMMSNAREYHILKRLYPAAKQPAVLLEEQ